MQLEHNTKAKTTKSETTTMLVSTYSDPITKILCPDISDVVHVTKPLHPGHGPLTRTTELNTPRRVMPNISRKRLCSPTLIRDTASPSHVAKMSSLFGDAALAVRCKRTPPRHFPLHHKKSRAPLDPQGLTTSGTAHNGLSTLAPVPTHRCDSVDRNRWIQKAKQQHEAMDRLPVDVCPLTPPFDGGPVYNGTVCGSPFNDPRHSSDTDSVELPTAYERSANASLHLEARNPLSSGHTTPAQYNSLITDDTCNFDNPAAATEPDVESLSPCPLRPRTCQSGSDDDVHSTHGVRLIMPYSHCDAEQAQRAGIEAWLARVHSVPEEFISEAPENRHDSIEGQGEHDTTLLDGSFPKRNVTNQERHFTREVATSKRRPSNKENVPPPLPPRAPPTPYPCPQVTPSSSPVHMQEATIRLKSTPSAARFLHPSTPRGFLSAPPKRPKLHAARQVGTLSTPIHSPARDFTIHGDDLAAALAKLSPSVEQHRKGRGPKRERCASYWDTDVLEPTSRAFPTCEDS